MNPCLPAFVPLAARPPGRLYEAFCILGYSFLQLINLYEVLCIDNLPIYVMKDAD